jgi:two-component system, LytTR family, response regulator
MNGAKITIIDDEPLARQIVRDYLGAHEGIGEIRECGNGFEGIKNIAEFKPDLVFLDIQMPKLNGFEMLELISDPPPVIFTTAFDEYALKGFEASAVDYLLKPFTQERFDQSLAKWKRSSGKMNIPETLNEISGKHEFEGTRIVVRNNNEISIVPVSDVQYIEAFDDYVKIFTAKDYFLKKKTMNHYEQVLNPEKFFRTHRSYIINLQELTRIEPFEKNSYLALLRSGKKIPLSRTAYAKLKERLGI